MGPGTGVVRGTVDGTVVIVCARTAFERRRSRMGEGGVRVSNKRRFNIEDIEDSEGVPFEWATFQ